MNILDLIRKKRYGRVLTDDEIGGFVKSVTEGSIPDYQTAAFLMAVCFAGMNSEETLSLTLHMAHSGTTLDLSSLPGTKADKHSTGGVGDKTTLVLAPLAAACGLTVAKLSGRGLGHTGGTIDKLEAIPGFRTALDADEFLSVVRKTGVCVASQSDSLAPADRVLYELRGVTGTVASIPLTAASVMSKKLAAGADCILLDVKCGAGAFMKRRTDATELAEVMVSIGRGAGRSCEAVISDMDVPLGNAVGNALEVAEALELLRGKGPKDLTDCCLELMDSLLLLAFQRSPGDFPATPDLRRALVLEKLSDGSAYRKFAEMVEAQGGDPSALERNFPVAPYIHEVRADRSGLMSRLDAEAVGHAAGLLGAGRLRKGGAVELTAGIILRKKPGDEVQAGEPLFSLHAADEKLFPAAEDILQRNMVLQ